MKKLIILLCAFLYCSCVHAQTDCTAYHTGYFMYSDSVGNTLLIHRRHKYQYEYNRKNKVRTQFVVNWINDCEYSITQTLTNSKALKKNKNSFTIVVILKSDGDNGYYYRCACKDDTEKRKEKFMKKITKQEFYQLY
jgi:hypothetical protein